MDNATGLLAINAICYWLIDRLKASKYFPVLQYDAGHVNAIASALLASLASAGIVFHLVHVGAVSQGTITLDYSGLTVANLVAWGYHAVGYFAAQKGIHKILNAANGKNGAPGIDKRAA